MYFAKNVNFQFPMCAFLSLFSFYTHSYLSNCIFGRESLQSLFVSQMYPEVCIYKYFFLQYFDSNYLLVVSYYNCIVFVRPMSFDISLGCDILSGLQVNISGLIYWLLPNIASTSLLCITSCWCLCLISLLLILFVFMSLNLIELPLSSWDKIQVKTTLYHSNTNHVKSCKIWWNPYRIVSCPTS